MGRLMVRGRRATAAGIGWGLIMAGAGGPVAFAGTFAPGGTCKPVIASVSSFAAAQTQTVTISGSCLGTNASQSGGDTPDLRITDLSADPIWNGCHDGSGDNDAVGCAITSWTDTSITFAGYGSAYGGSNWTLSRGDDVAIMAWNPQTGAGPAFCRVTAGKAGTTTCQASLPSQADLSSPAGHATGVTYTAQFKVPPAGLTGGASQVTVTAPAGTVLPVTISEAYDATAGTDLGSWGGGAASRGGATVTWTAGAAVTGGDVLILTIPGATNPAPGSDKLDVSTTGPSSSVRLPFTVTNRQPAGSPAVAPAQPAVAGASTQYAVQFTASPAGGLMAGQGQLSLAAPAGTVLPSAIADVYDVTAGQDLGSWGGGTLSGNGAHGTWTAQSGVLAGDIIDLTLGGVTNPAAGTYQLAVSTSSDGSAKTGSYSILDPASVPQVSGVVSYDNGGTPAPVAGSIVQACGDTACVTAQAPTDGNGNYSMFVPAAGSYTITAFAPTSNAYSLGEGSAGPVAVTAKGPNSVNVTLPAISPLPAGVDFNGESGTVGNVFWGSSAQLSVQGCPGGFGIGVVTSLGEQTGQPDAQLGPLTEQPAGSGSYQTMVPALYPSHGAGQITTAMTCPAPTALDPADGPAEGGTAVEIAGSGLSGTTGVSFGPAPAASFKVLSDSEIEAVSPPGSGSVPVSVTTAAGTISGALATYTYLSISGASPSSGPGGGGTQVTITGSGLSRAVAVYFGDAPAANVDILSDSEITATTPAGSGSVPITILTEDGSSNALSETHFTYAAASTAARAGNPSVTAPDLTADAGSTGGSLSKLDAANNLVEGAEVADEHAVNICTGGLGSAFVTSLEIGAQEAINQVKNHWQDLVKVGAAQGFMQAMFEGFLGGGGSSINLGAASRVPYLSSAAILSWWGIAELAYTDANLILNHQQIASSLDAAAPCIGDALLKFATSVQNSFQNAQASVQQFIVRIDPSGAVVDTNGNPISGARVTLLESPDKLGPFTAPPTGSPVMAPSVNPETTGRDGAFHWDAVAGFYEITAAKPGCHRPGHPSQGTVTTSVFKLPPPKVGVVLVMQCAHETKPGRPTVTSLSVTSGPAKGATTLDVAGTQFTPGSVVRFGSARAARVKVLGLTDILVTTPRGRGTVAVTVTTPGGTSATTAKSRFTYISAPTVTRISPKHGPAKGGTTVTITGHGFSVSDQVTFGHDAAPALTIVSGTKIVATAPAGAGTVPVTVSNVDGPSIGTAATRFSYIGKPLFSSRAAATATKGKKFSFTITGGGYPAPTLSESRHLPPGLKFTARKGGTATISGTPARAGRYVLRITAKNIYGSVTQNLVITVKR